MESPASFRSRFGRTRILWQTRLGGYCLGLDEFIPMALVPVLDDGVDFDEIERRTGLRFASLERVVGSRDVIDDLGIDRLIPAVESQLAKDLADSSPESWVALSPYPCEALPTFAAKMGIRCRSIEWELFFRLSLKSNLFAGLAAQGLPRLPGRWTKLREMRYAELASEFGARFVAQLDLGAAGSGTAFVGTEAEFAEAGTGFGDADAWIAPYVGALSLNVNAIATAEGTAVSYPNVQVVDQEALNCPGGRHCGNDFSAAATLPRSLVDDVREQTTRVGRWIASHGYRGLFGIDFVVDDGSEQIFVVDVNPRWQGSTALLAQGERRQGRLPLAAVEAAYQLGIMDDSEVMAMADAFFRPIEGSQLFPKNFSSGVWEVRGRLGAGMYTPGLEFLGPALRLGELEPAMRPAGGPPGSGAMNEILVSGGIPRPGVRLEARVTLLRVASRRAAVDATTGRALPWVADTMRAVYRELALERVG